MKQPHEGVTGADRGGDPLVSLEDDHLPVREALAVMTRHLMTATTVGNPAPVVARMWERLRNPQPGDLVIEIGLTMARRRDWYRGFGYLIESRREWWTTDEEYARQLADDELYPEPKDSRPVDTAWYVQYGPNPKDICRWTNCEFLVVPIGVGSFSVPAGERTGSAVTFTRDSLLGSLTDSGFALRPTS